MCCVYCELVTSPDTEMNPDFLTYDCVFYPCVLLKLGKASL